MYTRFFGLTHNPFSIAPDPRFVFMSASHREALAHLLYGLDGGGGFVLLTGEIGAGKTTVCRLFLEQIPPHCNVAYIFNPKQTVLELLQSVCDEFGVPVRRDGNQATVKDFIDPLNVYLLATHAGHQNNILIIDEAQNLSADVLEQLRLLTNLETNERKLLQIILIGQPELRTMLARPELEQLAQRVIARFHLGALSAEETERYIAHRMAVAGNKTRAPFSRRLVRRIHQRTRGIPRRINLVCDRALLGAYSRGKHDVDVRTVDTAAREVFGTDHAPALGRSSRWRQAGGIVFAMLAVGVTALAWEHRSEWPTIVAKAPDVIARLAASTRPAPVQAVPEAVPAVGAATAPASAPLPGPLPEAPAGPNEAATTDEPAATDDQDEPAAAHSPTSNPATPEKAVDPPAPIVLGNDVRDRAAAYRQLAQLWDVNLNDGDPCQLALKQDVHCFTSTKGLTEIRQLDRPGILTLHDDQNRNYYALLIGLGDDRALLRLGDATQVVSLNALARRWRGEFATLWRAPAGYRTPVKRGDRGPAVDWLAAQVAAVDEQEKPAANQRYDDALAERIREFQIAQGLWPDGIAGPQTFMQLAAMTGVPEPRLDNHAITASASSRK